MKTKRKKPSKESGKYAYGRAITEKPLEKQGWYNPLCSKMVNGQWV